MSHAVPCRPARYRLWLCFAALALGLITSLALCSPPSVIITDGGYFLLTADDDGTPSLNRVRRVIDIRGDAPDPDDPDGPDPDPDPDTPDLELTRKARGWAAAVGDPPTAQALALVYLQVTESIEAGNLNLETGPIAVALATDAVLASRSAAEKWKPFRDAASDELTLRRQNESITTAAHLVAFLRAVAAGLELAADGSEAIGFSTVIGVAEMVNQSIDEARE